ncbi:MAG: NAD(+)/NADH kinase [Methanomassiliicoccus sp.]|nr:NAD(+)/NADH kinase [Methanomassiliicoccus sp.]
MRLGITANSEIPEAIRVSRQVLKDLEGQDLVLESGLAGLFGRPGMPIEEMDIDALITVGGDGTILRSLQRTDAPIFGVNAGALGFLTEITGEEELRSGIHRLLAGDYFVEERIKMATRVGNERLYDATNEAAVHTAHIAKIRHFHVYVDDQLAMDVRADGIIVATPTGSTCYAMSVGGPIIDPRVDAFVIAPMAPFKFANRPLVVPASSKVKLEIARPKPCLCVIDGQHERPIEGDETVECWLAERKSRFVRLERNFYGRMREKLVCSP